MFQLFQLRCFVAVATELHFGRAAQRLNMTQPPLSRQIQLLEHELGVQLLERTRRTVRLTPAGLAFLPEAEDVLVRSEAAALTARRAIRGEAGSVSLGFIPAASYHFLPSVVSAAHRSLENIDLVLKEMTTPEQQEALASGRIDLGLIRPLRARPAIQTICVLRDPFILALPQAHPLAQRPEVTLSDLDGQPFIMYSPAEGRYSYELLAGMFRAAGVEPRYVQYLFQTHTILSLVSAGMGLALVPSSARQLRLEHVEFRTIDLSGTAAELHLAWHRDSNKPVVSTLRSFVLDLNAAD
ncbi:MAG: LysR family transcriptional regulator [Pseudomonas sp.]|jgi:DNA-binding transcriptional LysR family regulator|uniref:LysR family transcriptional regulator n=1 Tax=Pseudomonas sp. TaxID=306 RepID=UPI002636FD7C|nr:LysR family transcriptional regulator [Pseudomonas sp.]MDB6050967.1 LysR family transcriptional regulator [Pseudomonas sp.]